MVVATSRRQKLPPVQLEDALRMGLTADEWEKVLEGLGRAPNEIECAVISRLWSEEYAYKSTNSLLQAVFRESDHIRKLTGCRAGIVDIGNGQSLALRFDHNNVHQRREPYFGAHASLGAVIGEITQLGARPVAGLSLLRFGDTESTENQRQLQRSVLGLADYGNSFGVPVLGIDLFFHPRFDAGAMVNSFAVGVVPTDAVPAPKKAPLGSQLIYVGSATGTDGLPEAPPSEEPAEEDEAAALLANKAARVRVSDPLLAERIADACGEALKSGLLLDLLAVSTGGLGTTFFELSRRLDEGLRVDMDAIPLYAEGLAPKDILLSESGERVVCVVGKGRHRDLMDIFSRHGIPATTIGEVIDSDDVEFSWHHTVVANAPFRFLLGAARAEKGFELSKFPPMLRKKSYLDADTALKAKRAGKKVNDEWSVVRDAPMLKRDAESEGIFDVPEYLEDVWVDLLADPNLCSRRMIMEYFDQSIGTDTLIGAGGDAAVVRLKRRSGETGPERAIALSIGSRALYMNEDAYLGAVQSVAEAYRNITAVGARPVCVAHCLNFGNPAHHKEVADLAEAVRGLGDVCRAWSIPVVSDGVSLFNGTDAIPILPAPAIVMVGVIDDAAQVCSPWFKESDDVVLLLGMTKDELGCGEYLYYYHKRIAGSVPDIDFELEQRTANLVRALIAGGLLKSAHDIGSGGIAQAFTECCVLREKPIGAVLELEHTIPAESFRADAHLFSETTARYIVSCDPSVVERVKALCAEHQVSITGKGSVGGKSLRLEGAVECSVPLSTASRIWTGGLQHLMGRVADSELE